MMMWVLESSMRLRDIDDDEEFFREGVYPYLQISS